jgi:DNA-binding NtrC family response regulator
MSLPFGEPSMSHDAYASAQGTGTWPARPLTGSSILVIEDDFFIADDIDRGLRAAGARVVGPFGRTSEAREAVASGERCAAAVLDINVRGEMIFPFAEELQRLGIPFVFTTGYDGHMIPSAFHACPRAVKPVKTEELVEMLAALLRSPHLERDSA